MTIVGVFGQAACGQDETKPIHPYLAGLAAMGVYQTVDSVQTLDGHELPGAISIRSLGFDSKDFETTPIVLRLVVPTDSIALGGVELPAPKPFYMMTTELTNAQFAALSRYDSYEVFVENEYLFARLDFQVGGEHLDWVLDYLQHPEYPCLRQALNSAGKVADVASGDWGVPVRVPTLGEWCAVMADAGIVACAENGVPWNEINWKGSWIETEQLPILRAADADDYPRFQNILGNAAELVHPTSEEASRINTALQPFWSLENSSLEKRAGLYLRPEAGLSLGGSVDTTAFVVRPPMPDRDKEVFVKESCDLQNMVLWQQVLDQRQWFQESNWCTGVRFVIELPEGILAAE